MGGRRGTLENQGPAGGGRVHEHAIRVTHGRSLLRASANRNCHQGFVRDDLLHAAHQRRERRLALELHELSLGLRQGLHDRAGIPDACVLDRVSAVDELGAPASFDVAAGQLVTVEILAG